MIKRMTRPQIDYYLDRLLFLMSANKLGQELGVSNLTIDRWRRGESQPHFNTMPELADILKDQCRALAAQAKGKKSRAFLSSIAEAILADPPPEWESPAIRARNPDLLKDILIERCFGKTAKSTDIFAETDKIGYTRMQVYTTAKKLGIASLHEKKGRGGYSLWSMKKHKKR